MKAVAPLRSGFFVAFFASFLFFRQLLVIACQYWGFSASGL